MFKDIFKRVIALVSQPGRAWLMLAKKEESGETFLSRFVYPLIGLIAIVAFLSGLLGRNGLNFELALKDCIRVSVSAFGGFHLAAYCLNELWAGVFKREKNLALCQKFVGYSASLMLVIYMLLILIPEFFFIGVFILYTFYIVWEGATPYMHVEENDRLKFVGIATSLIILMPIIIDKALSLFIIGLRN